MKSKNGRPGFQGVTTDRQILDTENLIEGVGVFLHFLSLTGLLYLLVRIMQRYTVFPPDILFVLGGLFVVVLINIILLFVLRNLERQREASEIDPLTQVMHRRTFENALDKEVRRAGRYHYSLTLCLVDIDSFKLFNDQNGKQRGDDRLKCFAALLRRAVRATDYLGRHMNDTFCVLLPHTDLFQGERFLSRVMAQSQEQIDLSFSAGLTSYQQGENKAQFFIRAQSALAQAQKEGPKKIKNILPKNV
jgi:diguanylate cyclase (GGDEF)-like protein